MLLGELIERRGATRGCERILLLIHQFLLCAALSFKTRTLQSTENDQQKLSNNNNMAINDIFSTDVIYQIRLIMQNGNNWPTARVDIDEFNALSIVYIYTVVQYILQSRTFFSPSSPSGLLGKRGKIKRWHISSTSSTAKDMLSWRYWRPSSSPPHY